MKNGLVISDSGPIFSLAIIDKLSLLNVLFEKISIPNAVWEEITKDNSVRSFSQIHSFFKNKTIEISGFNDLTFTMDYGESESVILYRELKADYLLIDDKKAREISESLGVNCIGTLGILSYAKANNMIEGLRPVFIKLLQNKRYYGVGLLNSILVKHNEKVI
ncbi:MAG: DUF3368 domain-containing protein [Bacteroidetes bacterium]|nr:MAG: DUF3368 domain-containing protein [Bacteroidota bacterium]